MKFVSSIKSFRCYLQACKVSVLILWSFAFYYAFCVEWINRGKHHSDGLRWKMYSGSFLVQLVLPLQKSTCSGLEYSGWSIPVSFMLFLVTLSLHWNFSFFIELFQHIVYGWIVMHLYAQRYFLHNTYCCLHST